MVPDAVLRERLASRRLLDLTWGDAAETIAQGVSLIRAAATLGALQRFTCVAVRVDEAGLLVAHGGVAWRLVGSDVTGDVVKGCRPPPAESLSAVLDRVVAVRVDRLEVSAPIAAVGRVLHR